MRFLHTSDWHLGSSLYTYSRIDEQQLFLNWLLELIKKEAIDTLLVAGDIFDTSTPSNQVKEMFYSFLADLKDTCCKNVIITGGNHDSPSLLNAPSPLAGKLGIHIIGGATDAPEDEIIALTNSSGKKEALVCAVPFLRDRDIRKNVLGEDLKSRDEAVRNGIQRHYESVLSYAKELSQQNGGLHIIVMGHLFVTGSELCDGEDHITIGTLSDISSTVFGNDFSYVALGHIHKAQLVGGNELVRYCGSPLPMSFNEDPNIKQVILLDTAAGDRLKPIAIKVPEFKKICVIKGDLKELQEAIAALKQSSKHTWCEVRYTGADIIVDLESKLREYVRSLRGDNELLVLRVRDLTRENRSHTGCADDQNPPHLDEMTPEEVFNLKLAETSASEEQKTLFINMFKEVEELLATEDED